MRLEQLHLVNFGRFIDQTLSIPPGQVTVFLGPNEAGKSTLLAFIRAILFGFPSQYGAQHYPSLTKGGGGRIALVDDDGLEFTVERFAGIAKSLRVVAGDGAVSDADSVLRGLTGGATLDSFRTTFAFSLDELQAASQLSDSNFYNAGQGTSRLPALEKSLLEQRREIYLPAGSRQEVPRLLKEIQSLDQQLLAAANNAREYGSLTARKSQIDSQLQEVDAELSRLNVQFAELDRLHNGWEDWLALSDCDSRLAEIPKYIDFPETPLVRLDSLGERVRQAREDRDETAAQLQQAEGAATAEIPGDDLLLDRECIEAMRRDRNRFDAAIKDLPERQGDLRGMESDFAEHIADLGHDWSETELQAFDTSLVIRNQVDSWNGRTAETDERTRQSEYQLTQERRRLVDLQSETRESREKLPPDPPLNAAALSDRQDALRAARGRLSEYERQRQNHETLRGQLNALNVAQEVPARESGRISPVAIVVLVLVGVLLPVAGILLGGGALILGIVCGLVLLVAAVMLWFMGRSAPPAVPSPMASTLAQQVDNANRMEETARQSLAAAARNLGLNDEVDAAVLDSVDENLGLARSALEARNTANAQLDDATRREKSQKRKLEIAIDEHETAQAVARDLHGEWTHWLRERGLNETLTPEAMAAFLARVDTARGALAATKQMRSRVSAIGDDIKEFQQLVEPLAGRHNLPLDTNDHGQLSRVADELIRRLDAVQTAFDERERSQEQVEEVKEQLEGRERRLLSVQGEMSELLTAGGAEVPEDFRRRARQHEERLELERRRDEHCRGLERLSGPGEPFDAFRESLSTSGPARLEEESVRLKELRSTASERRDALREERGRTDSELEQLTSEEQSSALRILRGTKEEQLRECAREWSRLTIAETLLEKTRQKFEQERQPSVIRHAQEFFSGVTDQRYNRLYAPIGEQSITVTDTSGASKNPAELSRGTREQLYLALRFGLIREFGEHAERLPVVVDEALVNFDPGRARLAAEAFAELSETNQVLVFTCHPSTAEMFAETAGAQVVEIAG